MSAFCYSYTRMCTFCVGLHSSGLFVKHHVLNVIAFHCLQPQCCCYRSRRTISGFLLSATIVRYGYVICFWIGMFTFLHIPQHKSMDKPSRN